MQLLPPGWANLVEKLAILSQQQSTGELILSSGAEQWHLYLLFGRLLYATGGAHRVRRWNRAVTYYCPGFKSHVDRDILSEHEPWECQLLHQGINQNQLSLTQAKSIISNSIREVLFALIIRAELSNRWLPKKQRPIALLEVKELLVEAEHLWQQWQEMGLGQLFPDQAPVFKQSLTALNRETNKSSLNLLQLVNGTHTIWDIALQIRQPVTSVASALQRLVNQGILELQTVPDFSLPVKVSVSSPNTAQPSQLLGAARTRPTQSLMTIREVVATDNLARQVQVCVSEEFTGRLEIEDVETYVLPEDSRKHNYTQNSSANFASLQGNPQWSLFFRQGHLIGCASSVHPIRRWYRQLSQYCPELAVDAIDLRLDRTQCWDYDFLAELVRQGKILRGQMAALQIVEGLLTEILFDIHQHSEQLGNRSGLQLTYKRFPQDVVESTHSTLPEKLINSIRSQQVWQQAMQAWEAWQQAGLVDFSPNLAPAIQQAEELQRQTSPLAYQNLTALADGNRTLRDLALKLKQNLLPLTQSIMPYINQKLMRLIEVEDVEMQNFASLHDVKSVTATNPQPAAIATPIKPVQAQLTDPLIAYIDDSRSDSLTMSAILTQAGYRFVNIQDPVKALPMLLEHKPELIFLDLVMPIANGYEICAQIRRISVFKDTPVIILTSNDGIVDRVRAKMIGSSGFLAKPIEPEKVLKILQRYLPAPKRVQ